MGDKKDSLNPNNLLEGLYDILKNNGERIDEKAVSKAQQRFMGMVHAAQKGEKPASSEVAAVAKSMGKKDAKDFAKTKHKGLPNKVKSPARPKASITDTRSLGILYVPGLLTSPRIVTL